MSPTSPLVSVLVPAYNYGRYLGDALSSILNQGIDDVEIIVINDASTDDTRAVVAAFDDPRIRYVEHQTNEGIVFTLTEGISLARGKYFARLDADDRYRPGFFREALTILEADHSVGLVYGDVAAIDADGRVTEEPWTGIKSSALHKGVDGGGDEFLAHVEDNAIPAAAVIGPLDCWKRALPFPAWFTWASPSDWLLNIRIARQHPIFYKARVFADYRLHTQNMHRQGAAATDIEQTVMGVLEEVFSGTDRASEKAQVRNRIFGKANLSAANVYFSRGQFADARRCYLRALRLIPSIAGTPATLRHLMTTLLPSGLYDQIKRTYSQLAG